MLNICCWKIKSLKSYLWPSCSNQRSQNKLIWSMKGVERLRIQSFSRRAFGNPKNPVIRFFGIPGSWFWKNPGISWDPAGACPHHIPIPFFSIILEAKLLIRGKRLGKMVQMSYVEGCWHQNWGCSRPTDDFTITTHKICIFHKTGRTRKLSMCFFLHEEYPRHLTPFPSITSNCQVWRRFQNRVLFLDPTLIYENQPPLWHWAHQHSIKNTSRSQCPTLFLAVHASTGSI